ncbi:MAG: hypothetical protein RR327_04235 [Clostridia bacterium]
MIRNTISNHDASNLRELAKQQLDLALSQAMRGREQMWKNHNDLKGEQPLVTIEVRTFLDDIIPTLQCEDKIARIIEKKLLSTIYGFLSTFDDRVVPSYYGVSPEVEFEIFSIPYLRHYAEGESGGFAIEQQITDIERQVHELKPSTFKFDKELFLDEIKLAEDVFGDILPVKITCAPIGVFLSKHIVDLMGMENMMYALYDFPNEMREFIDKIVDEYLKYFRFLEENKLLVQNNDNTIVKMGTVGFTDDLPKVTGKIVTTKNIWGHLNSQETSSISAEMYDDFFSDAYAKVASEFGLYTYGCCEQVDGIWKNSIKRKMPNGLRKISISPWCNEEFMGEQLRSEKIIFHRKPSPNFIGVGKYLDEEGFKHHIEKTLKAAKGCKVEFSLRDIYTLSGELSKPRKAVEIIRQAIERLW